MAIIRCAQRFDRGGRLRPVQSPDLWALYAAFSEADGTGLVRIGVSSAPARRVAQVSSSSPFPVRAFLWGWVGRKAETYRVEAGIRHAFAARQRGGEWFSFAFADPDDKAAFHAGVKSAVAAVTGRPLAWTKGDMDEVLAFQALARRSREGAKPRRRRPWEN